jgi:hypothetical protein
VSIKSWLAVPFASAVAARIKKSAARAAICQDAIFNTLISSAAHTQFGADHQFLRIRNHADFIRQVPVRDYEELKPYIEKIKSGERDVLWKGMPLYFAKTSGTTSGVKYIPLTKESIPNHIQSARNALLMYINETKKTDFVNGKMIFLQGSPELEQTGGIRTGRLSGIVYHFVPAYLLRNRMPSYKTNCIDDWEKKVDAICAETLPEKMSLISGIPPWVLMYFERLIEISGAEYIKDIFPFFSLFIYGGVNYEPYRNKIESIVGKRIDSIETYPASEGFIAFQDTQSEEGMLLNVDSGIFYEFIPISEIGSQSPGRITLRDVEIGVNYALVISSNAGLWAYNIGDTIKFVSKHPYRIVVTGRIKHYISAFGEHVIGEEVEYAIRKASEGMRCEIVEFTVAPQVNPPEGELPYHEWFVEFGSPPPDIASFALQIDKNLQQKNIYYSDLILGKILQPLKITQVQQNGFRNYMRAQGKLGGQNKVARLANDRHIAEELKPWVLC